MNSETLKSRLNRSNYPVALTGAGISIASGLPTFDLLWQGIPINKILTREFFIKDPQTFYSLYKEEMLKWKDAQPNAAHQILSNYDISIVTQNFDGLHQKAGSKQVLELHGNLKNLLCEKCRKIYPVEQTVQAIIPYCECGCILRPDIVLFGERVHDWEQAVQEVQKCDLMLVIGTSLQVAPVNSLPDMVRKRGNPVLIINEDSEALFKELI